MTATDMCSNFCGFGCSSPHGIFKCSMHFTIKASYLVQFSSIWDVMEALKNYQLDGMDWVSWSVYHSDIQKTAIPPAASIAFVPL